VNNPTLAKHLNLLAGCLALDEHFRQVFLKDRMGAIEWFNTEYAPRYRQKPIEFSPNELKLVMALKAGTVEEFLDLVAVITSALGSPVSYGEKARPSFFAPPQLPQPGEMVVP
jgi:hypothetical protein